MPMIGFQERFVPMIRSGLKQHTIREDKHERYRPGQTLHLYGKPRQKGMYRIIPPVLCTAVRRITISKRGVIAIDGVLLDADEAETLAIADGFTCLRQMRAFFRGRLPFKGRIVHWRYISEQNA